MAQQPAVILIARHGPRLDAADQSWHLSTPTPYDPPITYGGWNQSRSLGVRIASLLYAREQSVNDEGQADSDKQQDGGDDGPPRKRRRLRHKVVIHTSPFLRCLQTSIAIAAGMAQYNPSIEMGNKQKRPVSVSPRLRATDGLSSAKGLSSIAEPKFDLAHAVAWKALQEHKRHRKSKLRVDAFLGEWLNPQYFEGITAPPPSAMMVTTAKAELMEDEAVEVFQPTAAPKFATNSLWGGANGTTNASRESTLDDWSPVEEAMPPSPTRSRANTASNIRGEESGRKSPFRPGSALQPLTSTLPKQDVSTYHPPTPTYAVSPAQQIPRGYVAHARNACTNVDYQWDSSRQPDAWGDGGEYGEEWSSMHKRFRRGLTRLVEHYTTDQSGDFSDDERVLKSADEEVQEDLVVILVTHGAGCNALIGALTGQPVLLDVGMASLTMAVRKEDAAPFTSNTTSAGNRGRRGSTDTGLGSIYDMKFISSSEHLRPGSDSRRGMSPSDRADIRAARDSVSRFNERTDAPRGSTNSALGSIRRPSAAAGLAASSTSSRNSSLPRTESPSVPSPPVSAGLWTPPASRTPVLQPRPAEDRGGLFLPLLDQNRSGTSATSAPSANQISSTSNGHPQDMARSRLATASGNTTIKEDEGDEMEDLETVHELPKPGDSVPSSLARRLSQERLWGSGPSGAQVVRTAREPKRRWTVDQD